MDVPGVTATPNGFQTDIDLERPTQLDPPPSAGGVTPPATAGSKPFLEQVPEAFRTKEWLVNFSKTQDPLGELVKSYDNQISLIGKKGEGLKVPGEGATPEDWQTFYKSIGVPESADKYEYKAPENVPEHLKAFVGTDEALLGKMKEAAIKAGLRPEGFKHLTEAFDSYVLSELQSRHDQVQQAMQSLENSFKQKFGEKSNQVLETWNKSLSGLGENQTAVLNNLDPSVKVVLAEHFNNFAQKYMREDTLNIDVPSSSPGMSREEYGAKYEELFAKVRQTQPGTAEHAKAQFDLKQLKEKGAVIFK